MPTVIQREESQPFGMINDSVCAKITTINKKPELISPKPNLKPKANVQTKPEVKAKPRLSKAKPELIKTKPVVTPKPNKLKFLPNIEEKKSLPVLTTKVGNILKVSSYDMFMYKRHF